MTGRMIHRSAARTMARAWQAGALVVALAAGALWALDLPGISGPAGGAAPAPQDLQPLAVAGSQRPPVERNQVISTAERLELARKPVIRPDLPPVEGETEIPASGMAWRYLGSIIEPSRRVALVSIDGAQRMIAEGRTVVTAGRDVKLEKVLPDAIVVLDGGQRLEIRKEERTGPSVAWVSPTAGGGGVIAGMNGSVSGDGGDGSTNGRAVESRMHMDPAEAQRMREQARRMANRNRAGAASPNVKAALGVSPPSMSNMKGAMQAEVDGAAMQAENAGDSSGDATNRGPM